jgi:hypothetical protein
VTVNTAYHYIDEALLNSRYPATVLRRTIAAACSARTVTSRHGTVVTSRV